MTATCTFCVTHAIFHVKFSYFFFVLEAMLSLLDSIKVKWPKEISKLKNQKEKLGPAEI